MTATAKLERSLERWAALSPKALVNGSLAQMMFCIEDAQKDIAHLAAALEASETERAKLLALVEFQHDLMTHEQRQTVVTEGLRKSQAKASTDNGTYQAQLEGHGASGDASRLSTGSGTGAPLIHEALEILTGLYDSIAKHGNYSAESTMVFVDQAGASLREFLAEEPNETLLDAAFANCKPGEGFDGPQGAN